MAKAPKGIPTTHDQRVMLRGRGHLGTVTKIDDKWVWVRWDDQIGNDGRAEIHYAYELVQVRT